MIALLYLLGFLFFLFSGLLLIDMWKHIFTIERRVGFISGTVGLTFCWLYILVQIVFTLF